MRAQWVGAKSASGCRIVVSAACPSSLAEFLILNLLGLANYCPDSVVRGPVVIIGSHMGKRPESKNYCGSWRRPESSAIQIFTEKV
jgi:hypothetical protein